LIWGILAYYNVGVYKVVLTAVDDDDGEDVDNLPVIVIGESDCMRTIGFWKHQFGGKGKQHIDDDTLAAYLSIVGFMSEVFDEPISAENLLWLKKASMEERAKQQLLASWLNFANGAVGVDDMVDTNYDGIGDMKFKEAVKLAEDILINGGDYEQAKNICDSINNMGGCD